MSLLVSLTQVQARRRVFDVTGYGARADRRTDNSKVVLIVVLLIQEIKDDEGRFSLIYSFYLLDLFWFNF